MSELGFQKSTGSSSIGLTFIRPLPKGGRAPGESESDGSSIRGFSLGLNERLFPPRSLEESGEAPSVAGVELGHFVMEERIGRGGMGAVFRALDKRLGRIVAVKVLSSELSSDPESVLRFENEGRAAARLDHENIARVYYIGEDHGLHFIAFEFVMGTNVRNVILQRGKLSPTDAVNYTLQVAEALRHTSEANVVHRDIKPSNIIISTSGRAKLVDLGLARHSNPDLSRELTTVGTALGTFDYIAPEQALDARKVDVRSDIYSLGCTLYHMLTGSPPYPTGTMFEKVMNHHRPVPPNPAEKNGQVTPQLARIVQKMMAANPQDRYANPDELITDLVLVATSLGLEPVIPDARIWQTPQREFNETRWKGIRTWGTVALILVAVVLADRLRTIAPNRSIVDDDTVGGLPLATPSNGNGIAGPVTVTSPPSDLGQSTSLKTQSIPLLSDAVGQSGRDFVVPPPDDVFSSELFQLPTPVESGATASTNSKPPIAEANGISTPIRSVTTEPARVPMGETPSEAPRSMPPQTELPVPPRTNAIPMDQDEPSVDVGRSFFYAVKSATAEDADDAERISRPTLAAACSFAKDGWTIELPVTGAPILLQETLQISGKKLLLRPSRDYRAGMDPRPVLKVDLSNQLSMGPFSRTATILQIDRGSVELEDIDIELVVDSGANADWSIATLQNGSRFAARGVTFTVANPGNRIAALVSIPPAETSEIGERMPERILSRQNRVELSHCLARGQFDLISQQNNTSLMIELKDSALALSGCVLKIDGSESYYMDMDPDENRVTTLSIDQTTLVSARGLLNATSGEDGSFPEVQLELNRSVLCLYNDQQIKQPMIEISGHEDYDQLRNLVVFKEAQGPTFMQLSGPFSLIDSARDQPSGIDRHLLPEQMGARNLRLVESSLILLPNPVKSTEWHRIQQSDLELRSAEENPAIDAAPGLRNAGADWLSTSLPTAAPLRNEVTPEAR